MPEETMGSIMQVVMLGFVAYAVVQAVLQRS